MRIESMTATFGKLEHQTLVLRPGLNVVDAPNEWGKSTWCAFLLAMLYGMETRTKSTKSALADKEHYAPWSGSPMSGRIELVWNDRRITIQRTSQKRIPMKEFRAYETESGLEVPELTGTNCGQMLLGVERSVFQRAGFIRQSGMGVTADDDLRRRLNSLVTTGEESDDGAKLQKGLRELKNRCCHNPTGQLPQARRQREQLMSALEECRTLHGQQERITKMLEENAALQHSLTRHQAYLDYMDAQRDWQRVQSAKENADAAQLRLNRAEAACSGLPDQQEIEEKLRSIQQLRKKISAFQQQRIPDAPIPPQGRCFDGLTGEQAVHRAQTDTRAYRGRGSKGVFACLGVLCLVLGAALVLLRQSLVGAVVTFGGVALLTAFAMASRKQSEMRRELIRRYGGLPPEQWQEKGEEYAAAMEAFRRREEIYRNELLDRTRRQQELQQQIEALCAGRGMEQCWSDWERAHASRMELDAARNHAALAAGQYESLKAMARPLPEECPLSSRTESREETLQKLSAARAQERQLRSAQGQSQGKLETMGDEQTLLNRLKALDERIAQLQRWEAALDLAQSALTQATEALQRRFAPQISARAQEMLSQLTAGKYDRLNLDADLTLHCAGSDEDVLREPLWRSDGTSDQLYLALRLAVARELTPEAPVILDDALVRFDDARAAAALDLLQSIGEQTQVILFSCQSREKTMLSQKN